MRPLTDVGQAWLHRHPLALDAALATGALVCMVAGSFPDSQGRHGRLWATHPPSTLSVLLMVLAAAALVFRRRAPQTVLLVTGTLSLVELLAIEPRAPVAMSAVVALYTVAATTDRSTAWRDGLLTGAVLTTAGMLAGPWPWYTQENIGLFAWTGMAAAAGDAVRSRRAFIQAMRERAERAERTREEEARRRVAEERLRIARDLHDVVAHHIALVNVQAGVAAHVMDRRPDQAKEALAHVREAGRTALGELRATVGLLRQSGDPEAPTEPAPGLERLDDLVETFRCAGLPVTVNHTDPGLALPAAVDLAVYRIIQEALTNVRKHAGTGASAEVSVVRTGRQLELTVLDTGPERSAAPGKAPPADLSGPTVAEARAAHAPQGAKEETAHRGTAADGEKVPWGHVPAQGPPQDARSPDGPGQSRRPDGGTSQALSAGGVHAPTTPTHPPGASGPSAPRPGVSPTEAPRPEAPPTAAPPGPTAPEPGEGHGGHGLIGMRERAAALGGSCTAGPRYGGGFRVHAILPLGPIDRATRATEGRR
ncbi:sensor histidine kinase [Streptomyces odontomachi]|uniref:sensor histidine kinase n=1 Tax=Streptomyces odontomachi TaxID=2944940 RepID=UPI00210E085D|nr:histidine kinase [Streptomyces sp. ODS25]